MIIHNSQRRIHFVGIRLANPAGLTSINKSKFSGPGRIRTGDLCRVKATSFAVAQHTQVNPMKLDTITN